MRGLLLCLVTFLNGAGLARADNPIVQDIYTADPAPLVYDNRVYIFTGHDQDGSTYYNMTEWRVFSSIDMANWQHHPSPMSLETFPWASNNAWAGQVIPRNNKFYFYVPVTNSATGGMAIGVGVSDTIIGPYEDAIGGPLLENAEIDPTVFIDDDGQAYLYWGNPNLWYVTLNEHMISYSGNLTQVELTDEGFGTRLNNPDRPTTYEEAPWLYKRDNLYYMVYAANCCPEDIRYSTGPSATGPWTYSGVLMAFDGGSFTNHPGVVEYGDLSYFMYHNGALPGGGGYTRSVAVESFEYNSDGTIPELNMTADGPAQVVTLDPYVVQEAETMAWSEGIETQECSEGGLNIGYINNEDYIKVKGVAFGDGAVSFNARVASAGNGGNIELHLDTVDGPLIGNCTIVGTGGWQAWTTVGCPVSQATGTHDLFFRFIGAGTDSLFNFNWWQFE
ncbi:glycosyl hydrolase [Aspergillus cavernicola]|uniref:Glycosyl hydrolase n=1 Tax=Aspergillus cavernicola TaxID=176166 RepID=A0ABR4HVT5_9EURO